MRIYIKEAFSQMRTSKKILSLVLSVAMVLAMIPAFSVTFTEKAKAYSTFSKNWTTEYYYPSGTYFVKNFAIYYSTNGGNARSGAKNAVGYQDSYGSLFSGSHHAYIDKTPSAAYLDKDTTQGTGGDYYIYVGYTLTTDPTAANACKAVGIETSEYGSYSSGDPVSATVSGKTVNWYRAASGGNSTYNPKLGDGAIDLNKGAGGKDIYMYATYDRSYGPAIDCFTIIDTATPISAAPVGIGASPSTRPATIRT